MRDPSLELKLYEKLLSLIRRRALDAQIFTDNGIRELIFNTIASKIEVSALLGGIKQETGEELGPWADIRFLPLSERRRMAHRLFNSIRRMDILQPLLEDDAITDIMVNGPDQIFYTRGGEIQKSPERFESCSRLEDLIQQIVGSVGRSVNEASPIADARLSTGERVNVVLPPVSLNGPLLSIRKFQRQPLTMENLIEGGTLSRRMAEFLIDLIKNRKNLFICGATSSGKTTLLNVLCRYIPKNERVITIEDSAELKVLGPENVVSMETRPSGPDGRGEITIRDLIKTSLRMNPDRLIVGEVRGAEAFDMLSGMNTGHACLSTGHANSCKDMLRRLESMVWMGADIPLEAIRMQIASALDYLIFISRNPGGYRKIEEIVKIEELAEGSIRTRVIEGLEADTT